MPLDVTVPRAFTALAASALLHGALLVPPVRPEPMAVTPGKPLEATVRARRLPRHQCATPALKPCPAS